MNIIKNERNKVIVVIAFTICLITDSCTTTITKGNDSPLVIQKVFMNMNGFTTVPLKWTNRSLN